MALNDTISLGFALPHRSPDPINAAAVRRVAQRAEELGFSDLWVTENTLDHVFCLDSVVALTYAAAVTTRIRLGVSVIVLPLHHPVHVAHQMATLDYLSGGRAILGAGLGRDSHYEEFQVPRERRVARFRESVELIRQLWTEPEANFNGSIFQLKGAKLGVKPVQQPRPPIWLGGTHPDAIRRAATIGDGWMGAGGGSVESFKRDISLLKQELRRAGRDPATFPISKRVFLSVHERADIARAELEHWFTIVYRNPKGADTSGFCGAPEQVRAKIEELAVTGVNHLILNPVCRYAEQLEALGEVFAMG
ncbi:MAG: LLM class flavin-dependent oxidoreductase [Deltaproteobacteria bacterium]|nr:LLM class flavin-dependent oxidoreductase [Deltaproteobacteria bacterium]